MIKREQASFRSILSEVVSASRNGKKGTGAPISDVEETTRSRGAVVGFGSPAETIPQAAFARIHCLYDHQADSRAMHRTEGGAKLARLCKNVTKSRGKINATEPPHPVL
jgi:hypothetical protein